MVHCVLRCLELGAGVGLTGMCMVLCGATAVTLTDYEEVGPSTGHGTQKKEIQICCTPWDCASFCFGLDLDLDLDLWDFAQPGRSRFRYR